MANPNKQVWNARQEKWGKVVEKQFCDKARAYDQNKTAEEYAEKMKVEYPKEKGYRVQMKTTFFYRDRPARQNFGGTRMNYYTVRVYSTK